MTHSALFSEPFARTGNIAGEGFGRLLGRPALGLLQTVIRESLQNSLDAARVGEPPVILIRSRQLDTDEMAALRSRLLRDLPDERESRTKIGDSIKGQEVRVLELCDFGTTGLGGPLRADVPEGTEEADFVNFIRNVGAGRDIRQGGGTYGYGKTSLYAFSRCSTVIVDSLTSDAGEPVRRFIGCHLGKAFDGIDHAGTRRRFTGRHWWGVLDGANGVDPLEGNEAAELAEKMGLPARDESRRGTSIMIIDPRIDDEKSLEPELIEALLWNFWPRMTASTPEERRLSIRVELDGRTLQVPRPEDFPPLDLFARALADLRKGSEGSVEPVHSQRPRKHLGKLAIKRGLRGARQFPATLEYSAFQRQSAMIALMRPVELVVRYIPGESFPDQRFEWSGVFICSDEEDVEAAFALAEPPAHDDWIPDSLPKGPERTWVNVALRKLHERAREYALPDTASPEDGEAGPSLARTAARMGRLLGSTSASGPGKKQKSPNGKRSRQARAVSTPTFACLEQDSEGKPLAVFVATLTNDGKKPGLRVKAEPQLIMDGGTTFTNGLGPEYNITVDAISLPDAGLDAVGDSLYVGEHAGKLEIRIGMPPLAAAGVRMQLIEEDV